MIMVIFVIEDSHTGSKHLALLCPRHCSKYLHLLIQIQQKYDKNVSLSRLKLPTGWRQCLYFLL